MAIGIGNIFSDEKMTRDGKRFINMIFVFWCYSNPSVYEVDFYLAPTTYL